MDIRVTDGGPEVLPEYATVPMTFTVRSVLDCEVTRGGLGGMVLRERGLAEPYVKDYDALEGEGPTRWARYFDLSRWRFFLAREGEDLVGGAAVAFDTPGVSMLEGRRDLAVLWDLRVHPAHRNRGVGTSLFDTAAAWASARGAVALKIETQNTNVPACRFYAARGCVLGGIDRFAYPDIPEEVQLLWYRELSGRSGS